MERSSAAPDHQSPADQADSPNGETAASGKREQTKSQNREAILSAGREVFAELGYEAASVRDIIRRTGLASGTFYNYFRSKEDVAQALAADAAQRLGPIMRALGTQAVDFETYLNAAFRAYFQFVIDEHRSWRTGRQMAERSARVRFQTPAHRAVHAEVEASIALMLAREQSTQVDAGFLAAAAIGVAREVGEQMITRYPPDPDGAADFAVRLIVRGLPALRAG